MRPDIVPRYIPGPRASTHDWVYVDLNKAPDGHYDCVWYLRDGGCRTARISSHQILREFVPEHKWTPFHDYLRLPEGF